VQKVAELVQVVHGAVHAWQVEVPVLKNCPFGQHFPLVAVNPALQIAQWVAVVEQVRQSGGSTPQAEQAPVVNHFPTSQHRPLERTNPGKQSEQDVPLMHFMQSDRHGMQEEVPM
jgi:hypothetical protein